MRALIQVDERRETMTLFMLIMRATQLYINSLTQIVIQCLFKKLNFSIAPETCYGEPSNGVVMFMLCIPNSGE